MSDQVVNQNVGFLMRQLISRSTGSHVQFVFEYGDGSRQEVVGFQLPEMYVDMTMAAKGNHIYTEGMPLL